MLRRRVIPILLLADGKLVKTIRFASPTYIGDPINAVRIFNEKEVDEVILVDITATRAKRGPQFDLVEQVASEAFMPVSYGGGVGALADFQNLYSLGVEKVFLNTSARVRPSLVEEAAAEFGRQSVGVAVDVKAGRLGRKLSVFAYETGKSLGLDPVEHVRGLVAQGAGEVLLTAIDREGTGEGLDVDLVGRVVEAVDVPVIAHGGAGTLDDLLPAFERGAAAVACGSMFVLRGRHRAVLISYLSEQERDRLDDWKPS